MAIDSPSPSARYRPEMSWVQIVYNEIVSVTNAMKRNQRWNRNVVDPEESSSKPPSKPYFKPGDATHNSGVDKIKDFLSASANRRAGSFGAPIVNHIVSDTIAFLKFAIADIF
jgi:hypothetical protein